MIFFLLIFGGGAINKEVYHMNKRFPQCVPLCGAIRAYGERAYDSTWWWRHENQCPMREWLHFAYDAEIVLPDLNNEREVNSFASWFVTWKSGKYK